MLTVPVPEVRRRKADVLTQLPPKRRQKILLQPTSAAKAKLAAFEASMADEPGMLPGLSAAGGLADLAESGLGSVVHQNALNVKNALSKLEPFDTL